MIRLAAPTVFLLALPALLFVLWRLPRLPRRWGGARRRIIQGSVALAALCAALAAGQLELGRPLDRLAVVFAVDRSLSVGGRATGEGAAEGDEALAWVRAAAEHKGSDDLLGLVFFGARAETGQAPSEQPALGGPEPTVPPDGSDLSAALRKALAELPAGYAGKVVLISDGVATGGDALAAAATAGDRGVPVDVLPIHRAPRPEVAVSEVLLPPLATPGEPVDLRVVTEASRPSRVKLQVLRDGALVAEGRAELGAGREVRVLRERAPAAGAHSYEVRVIPLDGADDQSSQNNRAGAFLRVQGPRRALILCDDAGAVSGLRAVLRGAGLEVSVWEGRGPSGLAELSSYDLLVLADLPALSLSGAQQQAIQSWVQALGGGLLMTGARRSFGLGGYAFSPVEEVLPASFDLRAQKDRLSLGMVMAIDKSCSMGAAVSPDRTKLDLANQAAAQSALLLAPKDQVGVLHVDTEATWTWPLSEVKAPEAVAAASYQAQVGGGGIYVDLTLDAAYEALRGRQTQLKHLLLFSDGSDSEQMSEARQKVRTAAREKITTSVVSMGEGHDTPALADLARLGGGRFFIVEDLRQLPQIFTQETLEASQAALKEEPTRALPQEGGALLAGIDFEAAPALGGHHLVQLKPGATLSLATQEGVPLLAWWQRGLGRGAVFTTDLGAEFGRPWLGWPGYRALFDQLARFLARPEPAGGMRVQVSFEGGRGQARVRLEVSGPLGEGEAAVTLALSPGEAGWRVAGFSLERQGEAQRKD